MSVHHDENMKKIAILTVNYRNYVVTREFIDCFTPIKSDDFHIFIADLSEKKEQLPERPWLSVIPAENKGYAHGVNVGIEAALKQGIQHFVVINNDTRVEKDFVLHAKSSLMHHPKSLIGGKIYYEKGYEYHDKYTKEESGKVLWYAGGIVDWKNVYTAHRGVDEVDHGQYDTFMQTPFITGCLMLFDHAVVSAIGLWDVRYFLYYEDADYCERAKQKGISLYYDPSVIIWHKNAQSTGGSGSALHAHYQKKNRLIFGLKYAPLYTKLHLLKNAFLGR